MQDKRFNGKIGEDYDLFKLASPHNDSMEEKVGSFAANGFSPEYMRKRKLVLEIGCGTGCTTQEILLHDSMRVVSVDNESVMIEQARKNIRSSSQKERVAFVLEDALAFLKNQNSELFDAFASAATLHNFDKDYRLEVLKEAYRVLKHDSVFVNFDKYAQDSPQQYKESWDWQMAKFDAFDKIGRPDLKEKWINHYLEDEKPNIIMKENEAIGAMEKIGFEKVRIYKREHMDAILIAHKL